MKIPFSLYKLLTPHSLYLYTGCVFFEVVRHANPNNIGKGVEGLKVEGLVWMKGFGDG